MSRKLATSVLEDGLPSISLRPIVLKRLVERAEREGLPPRVLLERILASVGVKK